MTLINLALPQDSERPWGPEVRQAIIDLATQSNLVHNLLTTGRLTQAELITLIQANSVTGTSWGTISGALASQVDLKAALDAKQPAGSYQPSGSYAASVHGHVVGDVSGLQALLDGKQPVGSYAAASHGHAAGDITSGTIDPARLPLANELVAGAVEMSTTAEAAAMASLGVVLSPGRLADASSSAPTAQRLVRRDAAGRAQVADPSVAADIATKGYVDTGLGGKAATTHGHATSEVTGLDTALAGLIAKGFLDAKGDLISASANDTPVRVPVGADGTVLTADSAQATGLRWAAAAAGGMPEWKGIDGGNALTRFAIPPVSTVGTVTLSNTMMVSPMPISEACRLRSISIGVSAAGEAGTLIKLWLFRADGTLGSMPNVLVADLGSLPGDVLNATNATFTPASPIALQPGHYMALLGDTAVTTHAGLTGTGSTWNWGPTYRTRNQYRMDFGTRGGTSATGVLATGAAPASIAWTFTATPPSTIDSSGGRIPLMLLDLIPA